MTRFLFERQQLPDGSMPRNSLTNGKPAPDSFNTQLDECAYPLVMALAVGLTGSDYYKAHIKPAANFVATPRAVVRPGALGGAERLLALDDLAPRSPACIAAAKIADMQRRPRLGRASGAASPTSSSATSRRGR